MTTEAASAPRVDVGRAYRDKRAAGLSESAAEAFAKHRIVTQSTDRWRIAIPHERGGWQSQYACELVVLWGGSILVHGDIDTVMWSRYSDDRYPREVLRWMGRHAKVDGYCVQKAVAGSGHSLIEVFDPIAFEADLAEKLADELEVCAEGSEDPDVSERVTALRDAIVDFTHYNSDPQTVRCDLQSAGFEGEMLWPLGIVTGARVYFAHAALRRLCALLEIT